MSVSRAAQAGGPSDAGVCFVGSAGRRALNRSMNPDRKSVPASTVLIESVAVHCQPILQRAVGVFPAALASHPARRFEWAPELIRDEVGWLV